MKTHDNQKPFQCTVCNRGYNTAAALTSHMQNHKKQIALTGSPTLTYSSRYSPRSTGSAGSSVASGAAPPPPQLPKRRPESAGNSIKSPSTPFINFPKSSNSLTCLYCTKSDFSSLDQLHSHIQSMHGGLLKNHISSSSSLHVICEFCTLKFSSVQVLVNHIRATHTDKLVNAVATTTTKMERPRTPLSCSPRLRAQNGQDELMNGSLKQEQNSKSPIIKEELNDTNEQSTPTDLSQPKTKKIKSDESETTSSAAAASAAFLCNQCTAAFPDFESFRTHLKSHLQQESTTQSLVCQTCGVVIDDQNEYEVHIASHFFSAFSEYACSGQCRKTFRTSEDLQKHLLDTHTQSMHKCTLCAEIFDSIVAIQMHFAVAHSNELKMYRCSSCSDTFAHEKDFRFVNTEFHLILQFVFIYFAPSPSVNLLLRALILIIR